MKIVLGIAGLAVLLAGCASGVVPSTAQSPDAYKVVHSARYKPADQLRFMDCVYDGFLKSQGHGFPTYVRQVKRADGYHLDVSALQTQYLVAEFKDGGDYRLLAWTNPQMIPAGREMSASAACIKEFAIPG